MRKVILFSFSILLFNCVGQKELTVNDLSLLRPTHTIKNDLILKVVDDFISKESRPNLEKGEFIDLHINRNGDDSYIIQLSHSDFNLEKSYRSQMTNSNNRQKGYLRYNTTLIVLQGEINDFFDCIEPCDIKDIFNGKKEEGILPIYEPIIYEFEILNGNIKFIGSD